MRTEKSRINRRGAETHATCSASRHQFSGRAMRPVARISPGRFALAAARRAAGAIARVRARPRRSFARAPCLGLPDGSTLPPGPASCRTGPRVWPSVCRACRLELDVTRHTRRANRAIVRGHNSMIARCHTPPEGADHGLTNSNAARTPPFMFSSQVMAPYRGDWSARPTTQQIRFGHQVPGPASHAARRTARELRSSASPDSRIQSRTSPGRPAAAAAKSSAALWADAPPDYHLARTGTQCRDFI